MNNKLKKILSFGIITPLLYTNIVLASNNITTNTINPSQETTNITLEEKVKKDFGKIKFSTKQSKNLETSPEAVDE